LRHGDHEVALQRFDAAERHVADASINDASVFYLNRGRLRLQRLDCPWLDGASTDASP
jgi:hypothetical protein